MFIASFHESYLINFLQFDEISIFEKGKCFEVSRIWDAGQFCFQKGLYSVANLSPQLTKEQIFWNLFLARSLNYCSRTNFVTGAAEATDNWVGKTSKSPPLRKIFNPDNRTLKYDT